jgi:hypothetical protein
MNRLVLVLILTALAAYPQTGYLAAQKLVNEIKAAHPEITGLELAANTPSGCQTIAATESQEVGQKCDNDELTAWKTNRPFVEQEKDEFDATVPVHDLSGKVVATAGMDFKKEAGRTKATVERDALKIVAELERHIATDSSILRSAK